MHPALPRLRPLGLGDIFDTVFRLYRQNFLTFIGIIALLQVPMLMLQIGLMMALGQRIPTDMLELTNALPRFDPRFDSFSDLPIGNLALFFGASFVLTLVEVLLVQPIMYGAATYAAARSYMNQSISMFDAYGFGKGRMLALIAVELLIALLILLAYGLFVGLVFLLVLGSSSAGADPTTSLALTYLLTFVGLLIFAVLIIMIEVFFLFATHAIILEEHGPLGALGRSWQLVRSMFWRVLGTYLLLILLVYIISFVPAFLLGAVVGFMFDDPINDYTIRQSLSTLAGYLVDIVIAPLSLIAFTLLYYDVRVRKEGYDLQLLAQQSDMLSSP